MLVFPSASGPPMMPSGPLLFLCNVGHIARAQALRPVAAWSFWRRAIAQGVIVRPARGVYACAHAPATVIHAATMGGASTCTSVLAAHGVWVGDEKRPHVQVPPTWSGAGRHPAATGTYLHWTLPTFAMSSPFLASHTQALWQAMHCLPELDVLAAMESAITTQFLSSDEVRMLASHAPRRLDDILSGLIANSGSGNETFVRVELERRGFQVEVQAGVPGMGHHDLLVNGVLGLEIDSRRWHGEDRLDSDRERWLHSERLGRRVMHITPRQVHVSWTHTLAAIERAVRDAEALQRMRGGRLLVSANDPL